MQLRFDSCGTVEPWEHGLSQNSSSSSHPATLSSLSSLNRLLFPQNFLNWRLYILTPTSVQYSKYCRHRLSFGSANTEVHRSAPTLVHSYTVQCPDLLLSDTDTTMSWPPTMRFHIIISTTIKSYQNSTRPTDSIKPRSLVCMTTFAYQCNLP
jgi:hypothetical protein